jgi:hypothetical protein
VVLNFENLKSEPADCQRVCYLFFTNQNAPIFLKLRAPKFVAQESLNSSVVVFCRKPILFLLGMKEIDARQFDASSHSNALINSIIKLHVRDLLSNLGSVTKLQCCCSSYSYEM